MTWESIAASKRKSVYEAIPVEWRLSEIPSIEQVPNVYAYLEKVLSKEESEITNLTAIEIAKKIKLGQLTSLVVTKAFCHRAALTHQLTTCCSEIFFDKAFERAAFLDQHYEDNNGSVLGPLHGVPISLKDQVNLEGIDSAIGYVSQLNKPKSKDEVSLLAKILEKAGAVFYVKTTTPMAMLAASTTSNIYGSTLNTFNRKLSSGGSSGGEGAIVGAKGAPLGFGTDIGGSIRIPSSFQGLYGLRASSNRIPYVNVTNSYSSAPVLSSVIGPMSWDLDDLKFVTKLILDAKPWLHDPKTPPVPWREQTQLENSPKLTFGIILGNGFSRLHPPIERALKMAREALEAQGHEVIEWEMPVKFQELRDLFVLISSADGYKEVIDECAKSGEPIERDLLDFHFDGDELPKYPKGISHVHEEWEYARLRYEYQQKFDQYWLLTIGNTTTGRPLDGILCPVWESASFKPNDVRYFGFSYTVLVNILDLSSITVPVTVADKSIDIKDLNYVPSGEEDQRIWDYYDPELYHGAQAGIQIITPRYEEERAIFLAGVLRDSLLK